MFENSAWLLIFLLSFAMMEFNAWFLHKYVMHGFLWSLHKDHHVPATGRWWEYNDLFALFFAVPSFLLILGDYLFNRPYLAAVGYGVMAYGFAYFFVHEIIIHRRLKLLKTTRHWYVIAVNSAHKVHHSVLTKENAQNFGMLIVPIKYFKKAWKN